MTVAATSAGSIRRASWWNVPVPASTQMAVVSDRTR